MSMHRWLEIRNRFGRVCVLVETLDWVYGKVWVFNGNMLARPDGELFKSGGNFSSLYGYRLPKPLVLLLPSLVTSLRLCCRQPRMSTVEDATLFSSTLVSWIIAHFKHYFHFFRKMLVVMR